MLNRPFFFEDQMVSGAFKSMRHEHHFKQVGEATVMVDVFMYEVPFGALGRLFGKVVLRKYMTKFLEKRNQVVREVSENL